MSLARHVCFGRPLLPGTSRVVLTKIQVDPEDIIKRVHPRQIQEPGEQSLRGSSGRQPATSHLTPYNSRYASQVDIPKFKIPEDGAEADTVYAMIKDELDLDGKPNLNLAR